MNIQFYVRRISDAAGAVLAQAGITAASLAEQKLGFAAVAQQIDYRRELREGAFTVVRSRVLEVAGKRIVIEHDIHRADDDSLCCATRTTYVLLDLVARKAAPLPSGMAEKLTGDIPAFATTDHALPLRTQMNSVNRWECDRMGHLNVAFFLDRFVDADHGLAVALGAVEGPETLAPLHHRIQFKRELREGAAVTTSSGVRRVSQDRIMATHVLYNVGSGEVSAVAEVELLWRDQARGVDLPLPPALRAAATRLAETPPADLPPPADASKATQWHTLRDSVESWECDQYGRMAPRYVMDRFSRASNVTFALNGVDGPQMTESGWGAAALEYVISYGAPARPGDTLDIRTAALDRGHKTFRMRHRITRRDGTEIAAADVTAVTFDLQTRKAQPVPPRIERMFD